MQRKLRRIKIGTHSPPSLLRFCPTHPTPSLSLSVAFSLSHTFHTRRACAQQPSCRVAVICNTVPGASRCLSTTLLVPTLLLSSPGRLSIPGISLLPCPPQPYSGQQLLTILQKCHIQRCVREPPPCSTELNTGGDTSSPSIIRFLPRNHFPTRHLP